MTWTYRVCVSVPGEVYIVVRYELEAKLPEWFMVLLGIICWFRDGEANLLTSVNLYLYVSA